MSIASRRAVVRPYPATRARSAAREGKRPIDQVSTRRAFLGPDPSTHLVKCRTVSESVRQSPTHRVFRCLSQHSHVLDRQERREIETKRKRVELRVKRQSQIAHASDRSSGTNRRTKSKRIDRGQRIRTRFVPNAYKVECDDFILVTGGCCVMCPELPVDIVCIARSLTPKAYGRITPTPSRIWRGGRR